MRYVFSFLVVLCAPVLGFSSGMDVEKISREYVTYLNDIGKAGTVEGIKNAPALAKECTKIINGGVLFKEGDKLLPQLDEAIKGVGGWEVTLLNVTVGKIGDAPVRMSSVLYELTSKNAGTFRTSAFLTFDDKGRLREINEVCEQVG